MKLFSEYKYEYLIFDNILMYKNMYILRYTIWNKKIEIKFEMILTKISRCFQFHGDF